MTRALLLLCAATVSTWALVAGGCGGKVEVDGPAPNPGGTTTGAGGAPSTTTTGTTTTSTSTSNGGAGPISASSDAVASTGDGPPPPPDGASVGTGPATCDFSGDCQACTQCAFQGACADALAACNDACTQFADCANQCGPGENGCFKKCKQQYPDGHAAWSKVMACLICPGGTCVNDCGQYKYLCGK